MVPLALVAVAVAGAFVRAVLATLLVGARAGEPDLREIAQRAGERRLADLTRVIEAVAATGDLRPDLDVDRAADILWTVGSPEAYLHSPSTAAGSPRSTSAG